MIFREYDIRGVVNKNLTSEVVELIGKSFGTYVKGKPLVVGHDSRPSSPLFCKALVKGLLSAGCDVLDIGMVPSPVLYLAIVYYKKAGGVIVTGSHNPMEYNGLKLCKGIYPVYGSGIQELREITESGKFRLGKGVLSRSSFASHYMAYVRRKVRLGKGLSVVIDAGGGAASSISVKLFRSLGCKVVPVHHRSFNPLNPSMPKNLNSLAKLVKSAGADIGFAFDGDADRLGVVDRKGRVYSADNIMVVFSRDLLGRKRAAKIMVDVRASNSLLEDVRNHNGIPVMWKSGHSLIKAKMRSDNILLAGELSGHFFFRENHCFDDAMFAAAKLLEILSKSGSEFSPLVEGIPKYFTSKEIRIRCSDSKKFLVVEGLKKHFKKKYKVITVDGIRVDFGFGWALVRASNTQPMLDLRFEAKTRDGLKRIRRMVYARLR